MRTTTALLRNTKFTVWTCAVFLFAATLLYVVSVSQTVHNTALRQELQTELAALNARIADLEFQTIALKNTITLSLAQDRGFTLIDEPHYVSRNTSVALASFSEGR